MPRGIPGSGKAGKSATAVLDAKPADASTVASPATTDPVAEIIPEPAKRAAPKPLARRTAKKPTKAPVYDIGLTVPDAILKEAAIGDAPALELMIQRCCPDMSIIARPTMRHADGRVTEDFTCYRCDTVVAQLLFAVPV